MYDFNSSKGVKITKFDEKNNKIETDDCIPIKQDMQFEEVCYLNHYECFLLMDIYKKIHKWT